jgi:hypothetical protein
MHLVVLDCEPSVLAIPFVYSQEKYAKLRFRSCLPSPQAVAENERMVAATSGDDPTSWICIRSLGFALNAVTMTIRMIKKLEEAGYKGHPRKPTSEGKVWQAVHGNTKWESPAQLSTRRAASIGLHL